MIYNKRLRISQGRLNTELGNWPAAGMRRARLAYRLDVNVWRDTHALQLVVEELQPVEDG